MHFALICRDKPNAQQLRAELRPRHLEWAKAHERHVVLAGPLLSEDGAAMAGSLFIVDFDTREAAQRFSDNDPYRLGGLFASVELYAWRRVLGVALD